MPDSQEVGLALLQGGAVLTASFMIRSYCVRHLTVELVPDVLRGRIQLCNRMAPVMLLLALTMLLAGSVVYLGFI